MHCTARPALAHKMPSAISFCVTVELLNSQRFAASRPLCSNQHITREMRSQRNQSKQGLNTAEPLISQQLGFILDGSCSSSLRERLEAIIQPNRGSISCSSQTDVRFPPGHTCSVKLRSL